MYQPKDPDVYFDDGREIQLLHQIYSRPDIDKIRGKPHLVLKAIDEFAQKDRYLMNIGNDKGDKVSALISKIRPSNMLEVGAYVGYSTILFSDALRKSGGKQYFSVEANPEFAAVTASLVDLAGLKDVVQLIVGTSGNAIKRLAKFEDVKQIDVIFLDHIKPAYVTDLKLCEELNLIRPGSVIFADNVIYPGNPPYLEYVRSTTSAKRTAALTKSSSQRSEDHFDAQTSNQYSMSKYAETEYSDNVGNPNLIYESELMPGFEPSGEPDGVEITRCVGLEKPI